MSIPAAFGFHTTSDEVAKHYAPQIEGKTVLITGVSPNGLGAEAAAAIAQQKPKLLILAGRSPDKCVRMSILEKKCNGEMTMDTCYTEFDKRKRSSPSSLRVSKPSRSSSISRRSRTCAKPEKRSSRGASPSTS